jgi:hypothetical protein
MLSLLFVLFNISNINSANIKLKNGVKYLDAAIITEHEIFPKKKNKIEVEVTLGNSSGRIMITKSEIYDIILNNSLLKPILDKKIGRISITDLNDVPISDKYLSPYDNIKTSANSALTIKANEFPAIKIGQKTSITMLPKKVEASYLLTQENYNTTNTFDEDEKNKPRYNGIIEEYTFFLNYGEIFGIFDNKKYDFLAGYLIETNDVILYVKAPVFYISNTANKLTVFCVNGGIKMFVKAAEKTFAIEKGQFIEIYDNTRLQLPLEYTNSPKLVKIYKDLIVE